MKNYLLILFTSVICIAFQVSIAQQKHLTIEAYQNKALIPEYLKQLQWDGKTDDFTYVKNNCIVKGTVLSDKTDTVFRLKELNEALESIGEKTLKNLPEIKWIDEKRFRFINDYKLYVCEIGQGLRQGQGKIDLLFEFGEKSENIDIVQSTVYSTQSIELNAAYTIDNNLYVSIKGEKIQVTNDKDKWIVNGKSVHRDEFGIEKGTFWSPKGNLLAFYRMDETMVTDYPLVDIDTRIATLKDIKYPMAGMKSHEVTVGIFNPETKQTVFLKTGEPKEQYLTNITWSPDEKYIYIAVINREQNHMSLNKYEVASGDFVKTLFEEKNEKYVEPMHGLLFFNRKTEAVQSSDIYFIWQSRRDGFNHLYLYNTDGKLIKQLTKGEWEVTELIGLDQKGTTVYYISNEGNPIGRQVYSMNIKDGLRLRLGSGLKPVKGSHSAIFNYDRKYFIDNYSSPEAANVCKLMTSDGKEVRMLLENKNPLKDYKLGETSVFQVKADDGTDLYCRMIKPVDFNPDMKYPVLVYVYGGPHSQMVTDTWMNGAGIFLNYFAENGYIVFTLDNRGTGFRGEKFEQAIFRNVGEIEMRDQMKGIEYLKSLNYVDTGRISLHGWSYGGFLTLTMMMKNPGLFKVAVAGGPVVDWKYYEVMYGERYMDTPEENPEGYKNSSTLNYVKNLKGKLLIIHGTMDGTVVPQHSLQFIKKCVDEGKQVDYFVYPDHEHNVSGRDRIHMFHKIFDYIDENLNR